MNRILIVEDDYEIAEGISEFLRKWDYETKCTFNFKDIISEFILFSPQLVLLDIKLPFMNGYHWCSEIRRISTVPIIIVSSVSENLNIVMAMNMGADDFITKPFDLNVLNAKIGALMRRSYSFGEGRRLIEHKGVILDLNEGCIFYDKIKIELSKNELRIMQVLFENRGEVVLRDTLMLRLWESDSFIDDNTLTVNITRLRKKLEENNILNFINTKKGMGYYV